MKRQYTTYYKKDENGNRVEVKGYTVRGCGVSTSFLEISKEEYDKYKAMTYGELSAYVKSTLSESAIWGYGYYGCELSRDDEEGLYFLGTTLGNSCD